MVPLGGVKLPAEFPAARKPKYMVLWGTDRRRQENGRRFTVLNEVVRTEMSDAFRQHVVIRIRILSHESHQEQTPVPTH